MKVKTIERVVLFIFLVLVVCGTAHATITSGTAEIDFPNLGSIFEGPVPFTAPQTVLLNLGFVQNDILATGINIGFPKGTAGFASATFNGEVFDLPNDTVSGLTVNQNMGASVTFDAHHIYVNFSNLTFSQGQTFVDISVIGPVPTVPEPVSLLFLGAGVAGMAVIGRRKEWGAT